MIAPPMPYSGGKQAVAAKIAALFPEHSHYVDVFGGALSVLLAKRQSKIETANDIDGHLVTFWRVLRNRPEDLERACSLTPHSRAEYGTCRSGLDDDVDEVEIARRVWVTITQSRGGMIGGRSGWRFVHGTNRMSLARYLSGYLARIAPVADRLKDVSLECRDAFDVIDAYDRPGSLFYVDPPYLFSVRSGTQYAHEFGSVEQHARLLDRLSTARGSVVLSGYDSDLYRDHLDGWQQHRLAAHAMSGDSRTEVVWCNFEAAWTLPFGEGAAS